MPKSNPASKIQNLIFDFDGTIADSFHVFVQSGEEVLNRPELTGPELSKLRGLTTRGVIKKLHIKWGELPTIVKNGQKAVNRRMGEVKIFPGIPAAIRALAKKGFNLYIVTSNSQESVALVLAKYGLAELFPDTHIVTGTGIFGKARKIKGLLSRQKLDKDSCIYIGDETRDIVAARKAGIKCIAASWGFSTPKSLSKFHPAALAANPLELQNLLVDL